MAEDIEENGVKGESTSQNGDGQGASAVSEQLKCSALPEPKKSAGETAFNLFTYTGIGYIANLVTSVFLADYYLNGGGNKKLNNFVKSSSVKVADLGIIGLKTAYQISSAVIKTLTLTVGGLVLLAPTKFLEDNKRKIVYWLNDKFGNEQTATDENKLTPDEIYIEKEQPHQSWGNMLWRRLEVMAGVIASAWAVDKIFAHPTKTNLEEIIKIAGKEIKFEEHPIGGLQRIEEKVLKNIKNKDSLANRGITLLALDVFFTAIASIVMYFTNGAEKAKMPMELDCSHDPKAHEEKNKIVPDIAEVKTDMEASNDGHFTSKVAKKEIKPIEKRNIEFSRNLTAHERQSVNSII